MKKKLLVPAIVGVSLLVSVAFFSFASAKNSKVPYDKNEKVIEFDGGEIYKVKDNKTNKFKDVVVFNNGKIEDYSYDKHAKLIKKDKASKKLKEKIEKVNPQEKFPVAVWIEDINHKSVEDAVKKDIRVGDIDNASTEKVDQFIDEKRKREKDLYTAKNKNFMIKHVKDEDVVFVSQYAPMFIANVTKNTLDKIMKDDEVKDVDIFTDMKKEEECQYSVPNINAKYVRDTLGYKGNGVKVGFVEMGYPDKNNSELRGRNIICDKDPTGKISTHSTMVTSIVVGNTKGIAPNATVYVAQALSRSQDYDRIEWLISNGVKVINYSAGYTDVRGEYSNMAKWIDHLAAQHNLMFVKSSGNYKYSSYAITDPGMAYNALTVGAIDDKDSANEPNWTDDLFSSISCYTENASAAYKPDVTAPGMGISIAGLSGSGTSYASPHATGVLAQLFSAVSSLSTKPVAQKSIFAAGTFHKTANDYGNYELSPYYSDKEGAGVIDAKETCNMTTSAKYVQVLLSPSQFPYSVTFNVSSLSKPVRVAVSWLKQNTVSGSSHATGTVAERPLSDLDLSVYDPTGNFVDGSYSGNNNVECVQFMPSRTGIYTIYVEGYQIMNDSETVAVAWDN